MVLFLLVSLGCFLIGIPISGYLLFFGYTTISSLYVFFQDCFLNKYKSIFGEVNTEVTVITGKLKVKKKLRDVKLNDHVVLKKGDICFFDGSVVRGVSRISLKKVMGREEVTTVKRGAVVFCGSINLDRELIIVVEKEYGNTIFSAFRTTLFDSEHVNFLKQVLPFWTLVLVHSTLLFLFFFLIIYRFHVHALEYSLMIILITFYDFEPIFTFLEQLVLLFLQKKGIYVFHKKKLFDFSKIKNMIFTKTGVLTLGNFSVTEIRGKNEKLLLETLAYSEYYSNHQIGKYIYQYCLGKVKVDSTQIESYQEFPNGIMVYVHGEKYLVGNYNLLAENGIVVDRETSMGTHVYVSRGGKFLGTITLSDQVLLPVQEEISLLRKRGLSHITMFSRDNEIVTRAVSNTLGIYDCYSELTYKDRNFWIHYLKDIYGTPQAYISDEECLYPVDIKILFFKGEFTKCDFLLARHDVSLISFLYSYSQKYVMSIRTWIFFEISFKFLLFFLLLWIRDILILGGILMGGVILFSCSLFCPFIFNRKGE